MPHYQDVTDVVKITKEIAKNLNEVETAMEVLRLISDLCSETEIESDVMSQWLGLLAGNSVKARKWSGRDPVIEIYPCGTKGNGKSDRLWLQVGEKEVAVVRAYESKH